MPHEASPNRRERRQIASRRSTGTGVYTLVHEDSKHRRNASCRAQQVRRYFATRLLSWFDMHGRHGLPWQHPRTAYRAWIAEVMLQQTQVATVVPYFFRFVENSHRCARSPKRRWTTCSRMWSGLGYYSRARNLHRAAQICVERHRGELPRDFDALAALPGIGRSTAGAILAQAHGLRFRHPRRQRQARRWRAIMACAAGPAQAQRKRNCGHWPNRTRRTNASPITRRRSWIWVQPCARASSRAARIVRST